MRGLPLLVLALMLGGCADPEQVVEDEMRYVVDHEALKQDFRRNGTFDVRVPGGTLTIAGEENDLCGDRCPPERDDVHVLGYVVGYAGSTANFLLGEYGLYGGFEVPTDEGDVLAEFDMEETDDGFVQWVHLRTGSASFRALH